MVQFFKCFKGKKLYTELPPSARVWDIPTNGKETSTILETSPTLLIFLMPLTCPQSYNYLCCRQWILDLAVEPYDFSSLLPFLFLCFSVSCSLASCCQPLEAEKKKWQLE